MISTGLPSSEILALPFHKSSWPLDLVSGLLSHTQRLFSLTLPTPPGSQTAQPPAGQCWELGGPVHRAQGVSEGPLGLRRKQTSSISQEWPSHTFIN